MICDEPRSRTQWASKSSACSLFFRAIGLFLGWQISCMSKSACSIALHPRINSVTQSMAAVENEKEQDGGFLPAKCLCALAAGFPR